MIVYAFSPAPYFIKISESKMGWGGVGEVTLCELLMEELNKGYILIMLAVVSVINN